MEEYDKYIVGFGVGLLFSGDSNLSVLSEFSKKSMHPSDCQVGAF